MALYTLSNTTDVTGCSIHIPSITVDTSLPHLKVKMFVCICVVDSNRRLFA